MKIGSPSRMVILSIGFAMAIAFAVTVPFQKDHATVGEIETALIMLSSIMFMFSVSSVILSIFDIEANHSSDRSSLFSLFTSIALSYLTYHAIVNLMAPEPQALREIDFFLHIFMHGAALVSITLTQVSMLNISRKTVSLIASALVLGTCLLTLSAIGVNAGHEKQEIIGAFGFLREGLLISVPLVVFIVRSLKLRTPLQGMTLIRLLRVQTRSWTWTDQHLTATLLFLGAMIAITTQATFRQLALPPHFQTIIPTICFAPVAILWQLYARMIGRRRTNQHHEITSHLVNQTTKRFIERNFVDTPQWAVSVGMRTANFLIDHDPLRNLHSRLPVTILNMRNDEIQRSLHEVMGNSRFKSQAVQSRFLGAIDPEAASQPCVEALKLFATLHLDIITNLERRLNIWIKVLPVIDRAFENHVRSIPVADLLHKNNWIFYLDFDWTDEHINKSSASVSYGVDLRVVDPSLHLLILDYLRAHDRLGNYIWMTANARSRIIQEAPILKNAIETVAISVSDSEDVVVFLAKFDEVIPRLQKYYQLDSFRTIFRDLQPSQESLSFLELVKSKKLDLDFTVARKQIASIAAFPWNGFREKDAALEYIMSVFHTFVPESEAEANLNREQLQLRKVCQDAIQRVGYPNQILHDAHIQRMALRELPEILKHASRPGSKRFHEAWSLLATMDLSKFDRDHIISALVFVTNLGNSGALVRSKFALSKSVEALMNILDSVPKIDFTIIPDSINRHLSWLLNSKCSPTLLMHFLDVVQFAQHKFGSSIGFDSKNTEVLRGCLRSWSRDSHYSADYQSSLLIRLEQIWNAHQRQNKRSA